MMTETTPRKFTAVQWMVLVAAFLGWMFDGLEQGLIPITAPAVLRDFMPQATDAVIAQTISYLTACFLAGAAIGGVLFGYLGDRFGRVRTMAATILAYSLFMGCGYFATSPFQLGVYQFLAALGMGGEWALGVALIMECWPERLRPMLAGVIGAASNFGFLLIAVIGVLHPIRPDSWRWIMLAGAAPAVLACGVLAFIPESQRWKDAVRAGGSRPIREIFTTHLLWRVLLATAFASVALIGTWAAVSSLLPKWANDLAGREHPEFKALVQCLAAIGAILGCVTAPSWAERSAAGPPTSACACSRWWSVRFSFASSTWKPGSRKRGVPAVLFPGRPDDGRLLRLAPPVSARAVSHPRAGHGPRAQLQLWPGFRPGWRVGHEPSPATLWRQGRSQRHPERLRHHHADLPGGHGADLAGPRNQGQAAAGMKPRRLPAGKCRASIIPMHTSPKR